METRGLVQRNASRHDRRLKTLFLTPQGRRLLADSSAAMDRINRRILDPLSPPERELFMHLLARLAYP
jgi:DNA-binding MarR family transcriptional regulator